VASQRRIGNYVHFLPASNQTRRAIWDAINPETGMRLIHEAFPQELVAPNGYLENDMKIRFKNGSTWQASGSDNFEAFIGAAPVQIVWSEWARSDVSSYAYLSPILRFNQGTAIFISTPLGVANHAYRFYQQAMTTPGWYGEHLSIADTKALTAEELVEVKQSDYVALYGEQMGEAMFRQEYYCDWSTELSGEIYGHEMATLQAEGRIGNVAYDPKYPVHIAMDVGINDSTAIVFAQCVGNEHHFIDYIENSGQGLAYYANELSKRRDKLGYQYQTILYPHDMERRDMSNAESRIAFMRSLGFNGRVLPKTEVADGINSVRRLLPKCRFDAKKCSRLIQCLRMYHRVWDTKRQVFSDRPEHDAHSDGADSIRYYAMGNVRNVSNRPLTYRRQGFV
jgi:phage terminase large subunit